MFRGTRTPASPKKKNPGYSYPFVLTQPQQMSTQTTSVSLNMFSRPDARANWIFA